MTVVDRPNNRELLVQAENLVLNRFEGLVTNRAFVEECITAEVRDLIFDLIATFRSEGWHTTELSSPVSPKNLDPEPWTGTDGRLRHSSAIHGKAGYCLFAPRPEYEQLRDRYETEQEQ